MSTPSGRIPLDGPWVVVTCRGRRSGRCVRQGTVHLPSKRTVAIRPGDRFVRGPIGRACPAASTSKTRSSVVPRRRTPSSGYAGAPVGDPDDVSSYSLPRVGDANGVVHNALGGDAADVGDGRSRGGRALPTRGHCDWQAGYIWIIEIRPDTCCGRRRSDPGAASAPVASRRLHQRTDGTKFRRLWIERMKEAR